MHLHDGDIFVVMRTYLDSSGKIDDTYMTLAAFAGNDETWNEFETEWDKILSNHTPPAKYIHMKELARQIKEFDWRRGWNVTNSFGLVNKCLMYMQHLHKKRFQMFYCAIDLEARRKLMAETYQIPDPVEMCNSFCSEIVLAWYLKYYAGVINPMAPTLHYFFDKDEYFKQPFEEKWGMETKKAEAKGEWTPWSLIKEVSAVDMRDVPGVQAADALAWGVNRENTSEGPGRLLAHLMRHVIPSRSIVFDEEKMRELYKPLVYLR
jgi:hypothetical protein